MKKTMGGSRRLDDIPELIHLIQLRLSEKEAARTSILSKSWLHAWSTILILRFLVTGDQKRDQLKVIDRTLVRYLCDNIPIKWLDLTITIDKKELSSLAACIWPVAIKGCLRKLSLEIMDSHWDDSLLTMPDDILYAKNLDILRISCKTGSLSMTRCPVINSVSLRELELDHVHISEEVLDHIFSTCSLLEIIKLTRCQGFKTIKIKNLCSLYQLEIVSYNEVLEINHVPKLRLLSWDIAFNELPSIPLQLNMVTQLCLGFQIMNYGFLDMIETKFPFLKSLVLTLNMRSWGLNSFHITCTSLKRLSLLSCPSVLTDIQVTNAQKLDYFCFEGKTMPRFEFSSTVKEIKLALSMSNPNPIRATFFHDLRHAITLSSKCDIEITTTGNPLLDFNFNEISKDVECPTTNVQQLSFKTSGDDGKWKVSPFFEAMFVICHPKHVVAYPDQDKKCQGNNGFSKLMVEVMERNTISHWPYYLEDFETKTEKGEALLPDYLKSYRDGSAPAQCVVFKLIWR